MRFTVFGARGFIGSHLVQYLRQRGDECIAPERDRRDVLDGDLGHAIWAIGLTADFRQRPIDTIRAHVAAPLDVLERGRFDSFLYLSSTRIYHGAAVAAEDATFTVNPKALSDLYNLSKLTGEALCYACARPNVRVARLSNVVGSDLESDNFLPRVIRDAVEKQEVVFATAKESSKDYVSIDDVVPALADIAMHGRACVYNVAAGINTTNEEIGEALQSLTGCSIRYALHADRVTFPAISIDRMRSEFGFHPAPLKEILPALVRSFAARSVL